MNPSKRYMSRMSVIFPAAGTGHIIVAKFQEFGGLLFGMVVAAALFIWRTDSLPTRSAILLMGVLSGLTGLFGVTLYAFASDLQPIGRLIDCLARCRFFRARMARWRSYRDGTLISTTLTTRLRVFLLAQGIPVCQWSPSSFAPGFFSRPYRRHASVSTSSASSSS